METLGVLDARRRFPELLDRARAGEETLISRHGQPVAALVPLSRRNRPQVQALLSLRGTGRECWPELSQPSDLQFGSKSSAAKPILFGSVRLTLGAAVAIDASVLVPYLRGDASSRKHQHLIEAIAAGQWRGVLSMRTLMVLVRGPLQQGNEALAARYEAVFSDSAAWTLVSLTPCIALAAARLQRPNPNPDSTMSADPTMSADTALELASALHGGASAMISLDPRLLAALP